MTAFTITNFGGVIPRLGTRLLPQNSAQVAQNVELYSRELRSWLKPLAVNTPTKTGQLKSMYRMYDTNSASYWLTWVDDVDVVKGPIAGDTAFKIYYTGDLSTASGAAGPRKTNLVLATAGGYDYPMDYLEMGVPAPGNQPTVIGTGGTSTNSVTRIYVYTYVTSTGTWAEEGPPSPLGTGTGKEDATWVIANLSTGTSGKYALQNGAAVKRIYRTLTDSGGVTNYQLALDSVPMSSTSTNDTTTDENLGVICPSFIPGVVGSEWVAPPSDLHSLIALPNGMMAGISNNLVCFCEPFRPHAWPVRYQLAMNFVGVSLGAFGQTLIATTRGFPYAIVGPRPDAMVMARIEENHPCISKRSTVSFPYGVAWATPDGLVISGVGGTVNAIKDYMDGKTWRNICFPSTIRAHSYEDTYFGFFTNDDSVGLNFVFDKTNKEGPLTFGNYDVQGAWNDPETAKLYILRNNVIEEWDADTLNNAAFDWWSKTFVVPKPVNFGVIQVDADYAALNDNDNPIILTTATALDLSTNTMVLNTPGYLALSGVSGDFASVPYTTALEATDLDIMVYAQLTDWTPTLAGGLIGRFGTATDARTFGLQVGTNGRPSLLVSTDGSATITYAATTTAPVADGGATWLRATLDADNGSSQSAATFYYSTAAQSTAALADIPWTALGASVTATSVQLFTSTSPLQIGQYSSNVVGGRIYRAAVRNAIAGTTVIADLDLTTASDGTAAVVGNAGGTFTMNGNARVTRKRDTDKLKAWTARVVYSSGSVIKSVDGNTMHVCVAGGTATTTGEPVYAASVGATATQGGMEWKRLWQLEGATKGSVRGHVLRSHVQFTTADPLFDGTAGNQWGFPLRGSLLVGGISGGGGGGTATATSASTYDQRYLEVRVYALTTYTTSSGVDMTLMATRQLTTREPVRLPAGYKSDTWEVRLSGNINVRYFKIAETVAELRSV